MGNHATRLWRLLLGWILWLVASGAAIYGACHSFKETPSWAFRTIYSGGCSPTAIGPILGVAIALAIARYQQGIADKLFREAAERASVRVRGAF